MYYVKSTKNHLYTFSTVYSSDFSNTDDHFRKVQEYCKICFTKIGTVDGGKKMSRRLVDTAWILVNHKIIIYMSCIPIQLIQLYTNRSENNKWKTKVNTGEYVTWLHTEVVCKNYEEPLLFWIFWSTLRYLSAVGIACFHIFASYKNIVYKC